MTRKLLTMALLSSALSLTLLAQPGGRPQGGRPEGAQDMAARHEFLAGYLGLSDSQKEEVKAMFAGASSQREQGQGQMQSAREALQAAVKANQPDSEIERIAAMIGALTAQGTAAQAKQHKNFYSILTSEQKKKLEVFLAQAGDGRGRP